MPRAPRYLQIPQVGFLFLLMLCVPAPFLYAESDSPHVVAVTGRGATNYDAREDAIRQALQQVVKQLVLAQRVVENDRLVMDKIASTMNGYVNRFTPTKTSVIDGVVTVEAEIEVSETRIENFLATTAGGQTKLDGDNILASAVHEKDARKARGEILAALLTPLPWEALEASVPTVRSNAKDPNKIDVEFQAWISPTYIKRLKQGLKDMGAEAGIDDGKNPAALKYNELSCVERLRLETSKSSPGILVCFVKAKSTYDECYAVFPVAISALVGLGWPSEDPIRWHMVTALHPQLVVGDGETHRDLATSCRTSDGYNDTTCNSPPIMWMDTWPRNPYLVYIHIMEAKQTLRTHVQLDDVPAGQVKLSALPIPATFHQ